MRLKYNRRKIAFARAKALTVTLLAMFPFASPAYKVSWAAGDDHLLGRRLTVFDAHEITVLDALLQLGQQEGFPMGIELVTKTMLSERVSVTIRDETLNHALRAILRGIPNATWTDDRGVILILPAGAKHDLFDTVIPSFQMGHATLQDTSNLLRMDLQLRLHPEIQGFAGHFPPVDTTKLIGPLNLPNSTVRAVLNEAVRRHQAAAWVSQVPPEKLDQLPQGGL